ncbi:MAG: carbon-nitrogen hydrolase [Pirellulales bacterium]
MGVGLVQMSCSASRDANLEKAVARIGDAAAAGAQVVCLQELFTGHYPCQSEDHRQFDAAEAVPGPTTEALARAASEHGVVVVGSLFERRAAGLFHNTAVVLDADGALVGVYRKMHIPDDPGYYEKFYFTPGDARPGFGSVATRFGRVGVCVCWDQWFPEAARLTALSGAEIIFYPTAIGWLPDEREAFGHSQHDAWETMMRSHAIANGVFVAATNRVGHEGPVGDGAPRGVDFWGASFIADPNGRVLARADHEAEETLVVECDLASIETVRTHWPFLRDRRVDAYRDLTRRFVDAPRFDERSS